MASRSQPCAATTIAGWRRRRASGCLPRTLLPTKRAALGALPAQCTVAEGIVAVHGTPNDDNRYLLEDVADGCLILAAGKTIEQRLAGLQAGVVLCAHSHLPRVAHAPNGTLIVNPGSVGCPGYADPTPPAHVSETGSPHARYALLSGRNGTWDVELIALEYDWPAASRRAEENGRLEWARSLATGFIRQAPRRAGTRPD
jgi:diadenosine tetraphosphatase ApaH/serine/threonine PP2A family protein phosphatase